MQIVKKKDTHRLIKGQMSVQKHTMKTTYYAVIVFNLPIP